MTLKILTVFGTRPEAVKLVSVVKEIARYPDHLISKICVTGQHREMLDPFLRLFNIWSDYDLNIMQPNQSLFDVTSRILIEIRTVLNAEKPDIVIVQGDTTTALATGLAAYYCKIPVAHVEAGLRSGDKFNPFPEEINRKLVDQIADWHFAPTETARQFLLQEGIKEKSIHVTGNTVIDALLLTLDQTRGSDYPKQAPVNQKSRIILVTAHRRENFGGSLENICRALKQIAEKNTDIEIIYPVHLNPNVQKPVNQILGGTDRIHLVEPLDYVAFVQLMAQSYLILTDSGGIQEEAPSLGKPVLVMRNTTERPEVIETGAARLVGTTSAKIINETQKLLDNPVVYARMSQSINPYGDGHAAQKIVSILMTGK
jgi:UDP-N-acetylglucosamine 2-epimerase (non-hydrolysing)